MKIIECFDCCLNIGCVTPVNSYYSEAADPISKAEPKIPYASFLAQVDLSKKQFIIINLLQILR